VIALVVNVPAVIADALNNIFPWTLRKQHRCPIINVITLSTESLIIFLI